MLIEKLIRFMGDGSAYNYIAMNEAVKDSGLKENEISNVSTGMVMGSGGPSIKNVILAADKTREKIQKNGTIYSSKNNGKHSFCNFGSSF